MQVEVLTRFKSSNLVRTPVNISFRSCRVLGQGYKEAWKPEQTFLILVFSCSPWKNAANTVL